MNDILFVFLSLSVSGSILALILFAIKPVVKNRLSQTWQYYIWMVVILRFLLPVTPQVSIVGEMTRQLQRIVRAPIVNETSQSFDANEDYSFPDVTYGLPLAEAPQNFRPETPLQSNDEIFASNESSKPPIYWRDILDNIWLLWAGVALALFVHKSASYRSFVRFVNAGKNKITNTHMLALYADELTAAKIKRQLPLYMNEQVASPMLVGILRPSLVLPVLETNDDELRQIFKHELTHFKRRDFLYKWIVQITLCLHWFNPLVYMINKQINKSCELSCDESVIKHLDEDGRITYGDALMASLTAQGKYSDFVVSITMSENVNIVKERLDMIMSYKKKSKFIFCISAMLTTLLFCGAAATGAYASAANIPVNIDKQEVSTSTATPIMLNNNVYTYLTKVNKGQLISERVMFEIESPQAFLYLEIEDYSEPVGVKVFYGDTDKLVLSALDATFSEGGVPGFWVDRGKGLYSVELIRSKESASKSVTVYGISAENFTDYKKITLPDKMDRQEVSTSKTTAIELNDNIRSMQIKKEYTIADLKTLNVSGIIVDVLSENVTVERGGDKLILEYLQTSDGEYVIDTQPDMGGTIAELSLRRTLPVGANEPERTMLVVIPDKVDFIVTAVSTDSGIIRINGSVSKSLNLETKSGEITIIGCSVEKSLNAKTSSGSVHVSGIATGDNFRAFLESNGGEVFFQPQDKAENYQFIIDTEPQTRITVNGKDYAGGDFKLNGSAVKKVYFDSGHGSSVFTVQDAPNSRWVSSLEKNFEKYSPFGVVYSPAQDAVYYNGERVRLFVDFMRDKEQNMNYAFDLCFQDRLRLGTLCLEAVEDENGIVTGVRRLDNDIASELLRDLADSPPTADNKVLTFDATLKMENYGLEARDLTRDKAPASIKAWMAECDKQQGAFVKENKTDSGYITYIYCNQGGRYPWNMSMHDGKVFAYLFSDTKLATNDGYTLLYYAAPTQYDMRLYLDGAELNY